MSAASDKRISELEVEVIRANVRIRYLEGELAATPPDTGMVREVVAHNPDVPTERELKLLFEIASKRWPKVKPSNNPERAFDRFVAAFSYLSQGCSYSDKRTNLSSGSWCDKAEQWLIAHRHPQREATWSAFALAASVLDYQHSDFNSEPAYSWALWLSEGSWRLPPASAWRRVLAGEPLHGPVRVDRPRAPEAPISTIRGGNQHVGRGPQMPSW